MFKKGVKPRWEDPRNERGGNTSIVYWLNTRGLDVSCIKGEDEWIFCSYPAHAYWWMSCQYVTERLSLLELDLIVEDDICGASLSIRFSSNVVTLWNRVAPAALPASVMSPAEHALGISNSMGPKNHNVSSMEGGIEKLKDVLLAELPNELRPQGWFYRVSIPFSNCNGRCIVRIRITRVELYWEGELPWKANRQKEKEKCIYSNEKILLRLSIRATVSMRWDEIFMITGQPD